jgi:hypothetical protein
MASVGADLSALPSNRRDLPCCQPLVPGRRCVQYHGRSAPVHRPWVDVCPESCAPAAQGAAMLMGLGFGSGIIMIGLRELALVAVVVVVLYGRSGVIRSRQFQSIWPWISPARRPGAGRRIAADRTGRAVGAATPAQSARFFRLEGNRLFWVLTILAATAVAAWVITRVMIAGGAGPGIAG